MHQTQSIAKPTQGWLRRLFALAYQTALIASNGLVGPAFTLARRYFSEDLGFDAALVEQMLLAAQKAEADLGRVSQEFRSQEPTWTRSIAMRTILGMLRFDFLGVWNDVYAEQRLAKSLGLNKNQLQNLKAMGHPRAADLPSDQM